jgi:hypothetical protein
MSDFKLQHGGFALSDWKRADSAQIRDPATDEVRKTIFPTEIQIGYEDNGPLESDLRANLVMHGTLFVSQSSRPGVIAQLGKDIKIFHATSGEVGTVSNIGFGNSSDASGGQFGVRSFGGTMQFRDIADADWTNLSSAGGSSEWSETVVGGHIYPKSNNGVILGDKTTAKAAILLQWSGQATFNDQNNAVDFRVESNALQSAIFVDGTNNAVMLAETSDAPSLPGVDTNLSVAGTVASRGTSTRGTSVFGGDVVISGSLHGGSPLQIGSYRTDLGSDVSFFVSGSEGSRGSSIIRGTSLFGGDVAVSGSLNIHNSVTFHEEWDNGNSGATATIPWLTQKQKITLTSATVTLTFTAPVGVGNFLLKVVQDASGSRTVTWPAAVLWPGGSAPTLSTAASSVDIVSFYYDGSNYYGVASLAFA